MSIDAFRDILLEDTFVLSWARDSDRLTFSVVASLLQTHSAAVPPLPGEWACYRPGAIIFQGVSSVTGLRPQESVVPIKDPDGSVDYGCIDNLSLIQPGKYRISGEFGVVTVAAQNVLLLLEGAA